MATYRIKPDGKKWKVTKNGRKVSGHRKKSAAKRKANQKSSSGDQIVEHGSNGQILKHRTRR